MTYTLLAVEKRSDVECGGAPDCPSISIGEDGKIYVVGLKVNPDVRKNFAVLDDEDMVQISDDLFLNAAAKFMNRSSFREAHGSTKRKLQKR